MEEPQQQEFRGRDGEDWQEGRKGWVLEPWEVTWGTSVDRDPGDGGRKQEGVEDESSRVPAVGPAG